MMVRWVRRGPVLVGAAALVSLVLYLYYAPSAAPPPAPAPAPRPPAPRAPAVCRPIPSATTTVSTVNQFQLFDFQPYWLKSREYWGNNFETRYIETKKHWKKLPLKVIVVPHSHNDPGWLKTFESYYHFQTRNILNHMAEKMTSLKNMTFIWNEMAFLSQWWMGAHPVKKKVVKKLLSEGRLEITTGGWVMTDEANSHVFAMVDQLIEGHQWVKLNLGITPKSGWSIDPFGHGSTVPYLLKASGVDSGTVIQRIHYAWKQWLAEHRMSDFMWVPAWDSSGHSSMLVHNQPFDIYSIKHSCGPHPQVCLNFDFRKISGEYTEYSLRAVAIDNENVKQKAELLLEQYGRTGSLFPHNVVLMPLGDDFRYDHDIEWDQQYRNYKRLFDYINAHTDVYNAHVDFGTVSDYFDEVRRRQELFQTLKGDFFVYSDIFTEGRPAYWSGYFTTRPYWKMLDRQLEADLRSAEILYTLALNRARNERKNNGTIKILEKDYERLVKARRNLALFQHHDAITGTSKAAVMHDYALKLYDAQQEVISVQGYVIQSLISQVPSEILSTRFVFPDSDRESYERLSRKVMITVDRPRKIVVFNSLAQARYDSIRVRVNTPDVALQDAHGNIVPYQINPVWNLSEGRSDNSPDLTINNEAFELFALVHLPALSLTTFTILPRENERRAAVYCMNCGKTPHFETRGIQHGDIQLENKRLKLLMDGRTGFLKSVTNKDTGKTTQCQIQFGAYTSAQFHSGAYLFMPDPNARDDERDLLEEYPERKIVIISGPVTSKITVVYSTFLVHMVRIYHTDGPMGEAISVQNTVDFEPPPKNRETELFMRLITEVSNEDPPEFYSDLNGFSTQKRIKVERIGIEGNYYPITSHAYIEDGERRITLLVDQAHGAAAWQPGWLEVMLDRRTLYDDARGMGEGIVDNKPTLSRFWIVIEDIAKSSRDTYSSPSLLANHLSLSLLYPVNTFFLDAPSVPVHEEVSLISEPFPCDVHLMNLRSSSDPVLHQFPATSALMLLHRQGYSCNVAPSPAMAFCPAAGSNNDHPFLGTESFSDVTVTLGRTSLTGLHSFGKATSMDALRVPTMEITSVNVTFIAR